jgi:hypothetical protein
MTKYKYADVRWNNGQGALLCDECNTIIAHGFKHEDKPHLCEACEAYKEHTEMQRLGY